MLTENALRDLREFIKRRIDRAEYRVDGNYKTGVISEIEITDNGIVRVKVPITESTPVTITQVRLISNKNEVWASKDVSITTTASQMHYLQWFDFLVTEQEG